MNFFPKFTIYRASKALKLIYGDIYIPIFPSTLVRSRYYFLIDDDYLTLMWISMFKHKFGAFDSFKRFKSFAKTTTEEKMEVFQV